MKTYIVYDDRTMLWLIVQIYIVNKQSTEKHFQTMDAERKSSHRSLS